MDHKIIYEQRRNIKSLKRNELVPFYVYSETSSKIFLYKYLKRNLNSRKNEKNLGNKIMHIITLID